MTHEEGVNNMMVVMNNNSKKGKKRKITGKLRNEKPNKRKNIRETEI